MKLGIFTVRSAASFKNQAALLYKVGVKLGYEVVQKDLSERVAYPADHYDRSIVLAPLWPRYIQEAVKIASPWITARDPLGRSQTFYLYGPVDGPLTLNVQIFKVLEHMKVITPSQFCADMLRSSGVQVQAVVKHGIDPQDFEFDDSPKYRRMDQLRARWPGRKILFSNINPLHRKGLSHLAKALKILQEKRPDSWIFILHTGLKRALDYSPGLDQVKNLVIEDSYNVLPFREIALKTRSCDLFVFPSLLEGFGLPVLEAMAARRAIVCLDAPPLNELVGPEEAWIFPYKRILEERWEQPGCIAQLHEYDPGDLAQAMIQGMDHPKESLEKADKAWERSQDFNYSRVYEPMLKGVL